jgi:hypothetical protein
MWTPARQAHVPHSTMQFAQIWLAETPPLLAELAPAMMLHWSTLMALGACVSIISVYPDECACCTACRLHVA